MRRFLYTTAYLFATTLTFGQQMKDENCDGYSIKFIHKDSTVLNNDLLPIYQKKGFRLVENGVYDFVIDNKKYFQALLMHVDSSGFTISLNWEFDGAREIIYDSLEFRSTQDITIRLVTIDKGVGGLPFKVDNKKYLIYFSPESHYCRIDNAVIIGQNGVTQGHYYFTGYGWKKLKMQNKKPYLCEETGEYVLRRK